MPSADESLFHELAFYALSHGDARFIHQHAVDAWAAQTATAATKPIAIVFGLLGLYLFVEKSFTGHQVQLAHMELARRRLPLHAVPIPQDRGAVTIHDVLAAAPGAERDEVIEAWCNAVWAAYGAAQPAIRAFVHANLDVTP